MAVAPPFEGMGRKHRNRRGCGGSANTDPSNEGGGARQDGPAGESPTPSDPGGTSSLKRPRSPHEPDAGGAEGDDWQTIRNGRPTKKVKKTPKKDSSGYPAITHAPTARLQNKIQVSDLRGLILYILADGTAPQWVAVTHRPAFRKVVVIMVPGLEEAMFKKDTDLARYNDAANKPGQATGLVPVTPDDFYPRKLIKESLPLPLRPFADMFSQLWPVRAAGNDRIPAMHSPITTMLTAPMPRPKEDKDRKGPRPIAPISSHKDVRTSITEYIATSQEYLQNGFALHPAMLSDEVSRAAFRDEDGWVHTAVDTLEDGVVPENEIQGGSITAGRRVYAIDCEMCKTSPTDYALTRISIVAWDGEVVLDELVKPEKPIVDYLTRFSGITPELLEPVTTTLRDIQKRLLDLVDARSILVGHSLDSDLKAIQLSHPFVVDTSIIYPHPAGKKHALKWLSQKYLNREIQKGHGTAQGHDSVEDARTCLDLVKLKCEKGKHWASGESEGENLFKRLARSGTSYRHQGGPEATGGLPTGKSSAAVDWGDLRRSFGGEANVAIGCRSDTEVEDGVVRAVRGDPDGREVPGGGVDFVWARMRELEVLQGWWNRNKITADDPAGPPPVESVVAATDLAGETTSGSPLEHCLENLAARLQRIYHALPPCTAFIVFSGSGDPREMSRLQAQRAQHRREYHTPGVHWDKISVPWADPEEQMLRTAVRLAREGIGFIAVK